jgi:hypothetical protein
MQDNAPLDYYISVIPKLARQIDRWCLAIVSSDLESELYITATPTPLEQGDDPSDPIDLPIGANRRGIRPRESRQQK